MRLATETFGDGPQRALLLHGISSNTAGWWRVGPALAEMGYTVTAPDLRGHGRTGPAPDGYAFEGYVADLRNLGEGWDLVLGHSLGGALAVRATTRHPGFAGRLVLEDPALLSPPDLAEAEAWLTRPYDEGISEERVAAANPTWHPRDVRHKTEALRQAPRQVVVDTVRHNPAWNLLDEVRQLSIPTLLVGADPQLGALVSEELGRRLADGNPNVRYTMIPRSSHSIHRDECEPFLEAVASFLPGAG